MYRIYLIWEIEILNRVYKVKPLKMKVKVKVKALAKAQALAHDQILALVLKKKIVKKKILTK